MKKEATDLVPDYAKPNQNKYMHVFFLKYKLTWYLTMILIWSSEVKTVNNILISLCTFISTAEKTNGRSTWKKINIRLYLIIN